MSKKRKKLSRKRLQEITDAVKAWEQADRASDERSTDDRCAIGEAILDETRDDATLDEFCRDTGISLAELETWNEQSLQEAEDERDVHPRHR